MVTLHAPSDHASTADAGGCRTCLADARESAVLITAGLWPVGASPSVSLLPSRSSVNTSPVRVERRSIRALNHINLAFGVLAIALLIALVAIQLAKAITGGN